ncbi:TolC family protein [Pandoraea oxalativorans]|uniref:TolC family protein n=1 Tax=Pandoraea oxalativorans TaxID=573737 RepID=UPI001471CB5D|nr:TolC family protein [Pandoraea oxalativorans]
MPLSLTQAIRLGLQRDPQIAQSWAEVRARAARVTVARAAYLPSASAGADVSMTSDALATPGGVSRRAGSGREASGEVGASWLLFDVGERDALLDREKYRLEIAEALTDVSLQQAIFDVAKAHYLARDAYARLRIARDGELFSQQILKAACARFDAGAGALVEVLRARTAHGKYVLLRLDAVADVVARSSELASLVGAPLDTIFTLGDDGAEGAAGTSPPAPVDVMMADLERRHPLLRKANAEILAEKAAADAARHAWGPTLTLVAGVDGSESFGTSYDVRPGLRASIGIRIRIPLFDGGLRKHRAREAEARVDLAAERKRGVLREVTSQIWRRHRALLSLSRRRSVEVRLSGDARQSRDIARERYREGVGSIEEIISAQTALADAQDTLRASRTRWHLERLALAASLGALDSAAGETLTIREGVEQRAHAANFPAAALSRNRNRRASSE